MADTRFYILLLILATGLLWLLSTGFIFWPEAHSAATLNQLSREGFSGVCHQFSWRSFGHEAHHMAVCSRCFGIYSGFFSASLAGLLLLFYKPRPPIRQMLWLLAGAAALNGFDVLGNALGWWTNTLYSRFFLGLSIGAGLILLIFSLLPVAPRSPSS
ncbi:MAG: DUF2085 domain-containing protein [Cyclonatronaceae bacterium]